MTNCVDTAVLQCKLDDDSPNLVTFETLLPLYCVRSLSCIFLYLALTLIDICLLVDDASRDAQLQNKNTRRNKHPVQNQASSNLNAGKRK